MDKEHEKKLEAFVDKVMEEMPLESPSIDFTQKLMARIETESVKSVAASGPLIPKSILLFAASVFSAMLLYVLFFYGIDSGEGWFQDLQMESHFEKVWMWFDTYTSSKIILYAMLAFGFLFMVQVPLLKRYMDHHGTLG